MKIPLNAQLPTLFMGNYFCQIPNTQIAFVIISKNACTFLKKIAIYNEIGKWPKKNDECHGYIGFTEDSPYLIPVSAMPEYEKKHGNFVKIAVWRNPMDRIISTYKLFCLEGEYRRYFHFLDINSSTSFERFMDFLRFEWGKQNPIMMDEHLRRQVDYFKPDQVDHIIPIEKLHGFLEKKGVKFIKEQSNQTHVPFAIQSEEHIAQIKAYYQEDYHISFK